MKNDKNIQEENPQVKTKSNKTIKIIIAIITLIVGVVLIYFGYNSFIKKDEQNKEEDNNTNSLITTDTLFLCPGSEEDNNGNIGHLELVRAVEEKQESEVCSGYVGKYECPDGSCYKCEEYADGTECTPLFFNQSFASYINSKTGIASIYDIKGDDYGSNLFLYDFKNNKKLTSEMSFSMEVYRENETRYFFVNQHDGEEYKPGIIDSYGKTIIPFDKYDNLDFCPGCSAPSVYGSIINNGVVAVLKNKKYGFVDIKTGKELTKIEFDSYGFAKKENSGPKFLFV